MGSESVSDTSSLKTVLVWEGREPPVFIQFESLPGYFVDPNLFREKKHLTVETRKSLPIPVPAAS